MSPARTEAFSDGVFSIAATLLVLDLKVPVANGDLLPALVHLWPAYASYAVSFVTIGIIWMNHHTIFAHLRRVDRPLQVLNLLLLLVVAVIRFPPRSSRRISNRVTIKPSPARSTVSS